MSRDVPTDSDSGQICAAAAVAEGYKLSQHAALRSRKKQELVGRRVLPARVAKASRFAYI